MKGVTGQCEDILIERSAAHLAGPDDKGRLEEPSGFGRVGRGAARGALFNRECRMYFSIDVGRIGTAGPATPIQVHHGHPA